MISLTMFHSFSFFFRDNKGHITAELNLHFSLNIAWLLTMLAKRGSKQTDLLAGYVQNSRNTFTSINTRRFKQLVSTSPLPKQTLFLMHLNTILNTVSMKKGGEHSNEIFF